MWLHRDGSTTCTCSYIRSGVLQYIRNSVSLCVDCVHRHQEVWGLQSETQKASQEWRSQSESLQSCLDALEERVASDREQVITVPMVSCRIFYWGGGGGNFLNSKIDVKHTFLGGSGGMPPKKNFD